MMSTCTIPETQKDATVGMGQICSGRGPNRLKAVLGSCVGVAILHPRFPTGVMAHVVLPEASGRAGSPGKFADTAIPHMIDMLNTMGVPRAGRIAKITGGSKMFAASGPMQVGDSNVEAVAQALATAGIRVTAKDVGGTAGRRVTFDCSKGELLIEVVGKKNRTR